MADSMITKQALAFALKERMEEKTFEKISVSDICESCDMNRKSFYYHFKDKYDLVNWIFRTEFAESSKKNYPDFWKLMGNLCDYLYVNKEFYFKAMQIKGQNSFAEYFKEYLYSFISEYIDPFLEGEERRAFYILFLTDACVASIERWILPQNGITPKKFLELMQSCIADMGRKILWNI